MVKKMINKPLKIGIVGATGLVGREVLKVLDEYHVNIAKLKLFASNKSKNQKILFNQKEYTIDIISAESFDDLDYVIFCTPSEISLKYAPIAKAKGAIVIDNSAAFRMDKNTSLVVPEINIKDINLSQNRIISNPNCSTIQSVLPLYVINKISKIKKIVYSTYQSVSGYGAKGLYDLEITKEGFSPEFFHDNISLNCIPEIGNYTENGFTSEETKMINETKKILHLSDTKISATCVRVPIENCHAVSIYVETETDFEISLISDALSKQEGIKFIKYDNNHHYPLQSTANNQDDVIVGRLRYGPTKNSLLLYCVADNLRKGAASNAVQIMMSINNHSI